MSGVEAIAVLGVISSVIAIADEAKKVYDAAGDKAGLPEEFREVAGRLPIVKTILLSSKEQISLGNVGEASCQAMKPVMEACEEKAKKLDEIFHKVLPSADASHRERYLSALKTLGKVGRVETLISSSYFIDPI